MRRGTIAVVSTATAATVAAAVVRSRRNVRDIERLHPPTGRFVTTPQRICLHYVRRGKGRPVMLLHGSMSQLQDMTSSLLPTLGSRYEVFAFDRPGYGHSKTLLQYASAADQAQAIHAAAQLLRLDRPTLVGHGVGGTVALAYAVMFPEAVSGAVLVSAPAYAGPSRFDAMKLPGVGRLLAHALYQTLQSKRVAGALRHRFAPQPIPPHLVRELPSEMLCRPRVIEATAQDRSLIGHSLMVLERRYRRCTVPIAILAGEQDRIVDPRHHAVPLAKQLRNASLQVLPDCGHMLHHFEQERIAAAIEHVQAADERGLDLDARWNDLSVMDYPQFARPPVGARAIPRDPTGSDLY